MSHTLRAATAADRDWLWTLSRATMKTHVEQTWGRWDDVEQAERFQKNFQPQRLQIIVVNGHDAGLLHVERTPADIFLASILLAAEFQNRGLGTAILHSLLAEAHREKLPLRLQVLKVNPARRLYERLGFTVTAETPTHYQMRWTP
ncbi:MAG: GNAT family N-acetyltransferase [Opitutaceae bacterium]|nr:GNAT family N-acetyltransferase [Opitutaceae bacterium]